MDQKTIIYEYINEMKNVEDCLLQYLEEEEDSLMKENLKILLCKINDLQILKNKHELNLLLHLISEVSNNHFRFPNFKKKIEKILISIKEEISEFFPNDKICDIFKDNKLVLLILFEKEIITPDELIVKIFRDQPYSNKYEEFFYPEFKSPFNNFSKDYLANPDYFYSKRELGQNDNILCEIIQKDLIQDFIIYK